MGNRILIVDDEASLRRLLRTALANAGYDVREAADGQGSLRMAADERPDMVLLDLGLPDIEGLDVLKRLRKWSKVPVIVLTVRDSDADKVAALDSGADDYLTKPFSIPELLARLRVAKRHSSINPDDPVFRSGPLEMNFDSRAVSMGGRDIKLTATEYELLAVLARNAGKVVTHNELLKDVWGSYSVEHTQYLRVYMGKLRKKLRTGDMTELISTETGVGYRLALL